MGSKRTLEAPKVGARYGLLTIIGVVDPARPASTARVRVLCRCGSPEKEVQFRYLLSGATRSCGCLHRTHGETRTALYRKWGAMFVRSKREAIQVCPEWRRYEAFRDWSAANGYAEGLALDLVNHTEGYSPANCRWVSRVAIPRRKGTRLPPVTAFGLTRPLAELLRDPRCVVDYNRARARIRAGWDHEVALTRAAGRYCRRPK